LTVLKQIIVNVEYIIVAKTNVNNLVKSNLAQIKTLMTQYGVIKASLFGSAANGTMNTCRIAGNNPSIPSYDVIK
jgi:hypothetical protein